MNSKLILIMIHIADIIIGNTVINIVNKLLNNIINIINYIVNIIVFLFLSKYSSSAIDLSSFNFFKSLNSLAISNLAIILSFIILYSSSSCFDMKLPSSVRSPCRLISLFSFNKLGKFIVSIYKILFFLSGSIYRTSS